jgi:hypothetical protein
LQPVWPEMFGKSGHWTLLRMIFPYNIIFALASWSSRIFSACRGDELWVVSSNPAGVYVHM